LKHSDIIQELSPRCHHLIRQHIVPAGSGLLFSSKSNLNKKTDIWDDIPNIRTGAESADLIYSDFIQESSQLYFKLEKSTNIQEIAVL
jgi:hypothetical protein